jgi:hypothetical protein
METQVLLDPGETAKRLHVVKGTLAIWRHYKRKKLPFVKIGRKVFYRPQDLDAFIAANVLPGDGSETEPTTKRKRATR